MVSNVPHTVIAANDSAGKCGPLAGSCPQMYFPNEQDAREWVSDIIEAWRKNNTNDFSGWYMRDKPVFKVLRDPKHEIIGRVFK